MKLRIRSTAKKETIRVEASDASSLFDLKTLIASKLSSSFAPIHPEAVHLSLNRAEEMAASAPGESLAALGLVSGDLLFYSLNSGFCSTPSNLASTPAVIAFTEPSSESHPKAPADDMDIKGESGDFLQEKAPSVPCFLPSVMGAEKVKINGNMGLNFGASPPGFGVSSQKRAKPSSTHGDANSVKAVWKKAKAVSFGGATVCCPSVSPAKSLQGKATPLVTPCYKVPLQSSKQKDAAGGTPPGLRTPPCLRTPGILPDDLPAASGARLKELPPPQPPFGRLSSDHDAAISANAVKSSSQGKATPLVTPRAKGMDATGGTPPCSRTPGILSDDLPTANGARSKDHVATICASPAKSTSQGKTTPMATPRDKGALQSSRGMEATGGTPPNSRTPGIPSDDLPSTSEARSMDVPLPHFGRSPFDHVASISSLISGPTAVGDLQSRLVAYVADMEARMRVVELSNLPSRVTALESRMVLVEGYEPRLEAAEERYSEIADVRVQISKIQRQVDHLIVDFARVTHSVGTSSEQALVLELVHQGKQHLAQAEALFQTATSLPYNARHAPNP